MKLVAVPVDPKSIAPVINKLSLLVIKLFPEEAIDAEPANVIVPFKVDIFPKFLIVPKFVYPVPVILNGSLIV